jgi:hypothetical protein
MLKNIWHGSLIDSKITVLLSGEIGGIGGIFAASPVAGR